MKKLILPIIGGALLTLLALTLTACGGKATASSSPGASTAVVTTLAGKAGVTGSADGSGAAARFNNPFDVAVDAAGNVYVTTATTPSARSHPPGWSRPSPARPVPGQYRRQGPAARLTDPCGIAINAAGDFYVSEAGPNVILKITPAGQVTTLAGKYDVTGSTDGKGAAARFSWPPGVACDSAGNVYVADLHNNAIRKITPAGVVTTLAGKAGQLGSVDGTGAAASFNGPCGVACDAAGNLYVVDQNNNTIRKITPAGVVTTFAGKAGVSGSADGTGAAASFSIPTGICYDPANGDLYVADSENCTIRRITPAGVVTTIAGKYGSVGSADGTGAAASFDSPTGVAVDAAGDLYVCDQTNNTIRKITFTK